MLSTQNTKIVVLFSLTVATFLFSLIPIALRAWFVRLHDRASRRRMKSAISLLNCFTAGVFLATCMLDLFPEVLEWADKLLKKFNSNSEFPVAQVLVLLGFILLLIVEQFVTRWKANHGEHIHDHHGHSHNHADFSSSYGSMDSHQVSNERSPLNAADPERNPLSEDEENPAGTTEEEEEPSPDPAKHSVLRPLMLLTALSLHSVFEGLAIGLQTTANDVLQIFLALTLHKCIVAFSIGLNNVQSSFPLKLIIFLNFFFSLMSPIGIAIGIAIGHLSDQSETVVATAILQGLACGTFLYVVFMEILPHEFMVRRNRPDRMLKVLCLIIGLAVVVGIISLDPAN